MIKKCNRKETEVVKFCLYLRGLIEALEGLIDE
jgi:hypothetical protein